VEADVRQVTWTAPAREAAAAYEGAVRAMRTADELFRDAVDMDQVLDQASRVLAREPGDVCVLSLVREADDSLEPVRAVHGYRRNGLDVDQSDAFSRGARHERAAFRMPISDPSLLRLWLPRAYWSYVERYPLSSVLAAPMLQRGRVRGTLVLWREQPRPAFDDADQAYVAAVANRLAAAVDVM
jgi:GAF domain-containing protein